jgi:hypothetical protein
LRTPGVTDFFRILNEEIEAISSIDDHGEVMLQTAKMALKLMKGFQVLVLSLVPWLHSHI